MQTNDTNMDQSNSEWAPLLGKTTIGIYHPQSIGAKFAPLDQPDTFYPVKFFAGLNDGDLVAVCVTQNINPEKPQVYDPFYLGTGSFQKIKPIQFFTAHDLGFNSEEDAFFDIFNQWSRKASIVLHRASRMIKYAIPIVRLGEECFLGFSKVGDDLVCPKDELLLRVEQPLDEVLTQSHFDRWTANGVDCFTPESKLLLDFGQQKTWDSRLVLLHQGGEWFSFSEFADELNTQRSFASAFCQELRLSGTQGIKTYLIAQCIFQHPAVLNTNSDAIDCDLFLSDFQRRVGVPLTKEDVDNVLNVSGGKHLSKQGQQYVLSDSVRNYGNQNWRDQNEIFFDKWLFWILWNTPLENLMPKPKGPEEEFLEHLTDYIERCGFKYSPEDVVRFHTSVKCGMLTLVGGNPGTGKSSLVELYFRALGGKGKNASSIDTFLRIDVNPSWMEPADLLGYNDAEGKFRPASNGFWRFLRDKQEDELLHPICLEEINLARVEHYFSDFIQMMSRGGGRISAGDNATDSIVIDDRVRFVGTCNLDETTHSMSLRLLDRCSFIELDQDEETRKQLEENIWSEPEPTPLPFEESDGVSSSTFNGWVYTASEKQISEAIRKDFSDFQTEFAGAGIAPSPRVVSDIAKYIRNRPAFNGKDVSLEEEDRQRKALDECIAQRILSRYRPSPGNIAAFRNLESKLGSLYPLSAGLAKRKDDEYKRAVSLSESWQ